MNEPQHPNELPKDIVDRLRRIVTFTGNQRAVDEDPVKMLSMLLYGIEDHLNEGSIRYVVYDCCSAEGVQLHSRWLHEEMKTA
jgi:hypothetical protein